MARDKIIISDSLGGGLDWMQRGSEGWEKGGKAGQDANINPLENLLNIRQKENHQFCTFQVSR